MSQRKKKVVTTDTSKTRKNIVRSKAKTRPSTRIRVEKKQTEPLLFSKDNYAWMLLGVGLIVLGMFLMSGGSMPSPDVWEDDIIYSARRTILAPIVILAGLAVEIYAIFK